MKVVWIALIIAVVVAYVIFGSIREAHPPAPAPHCSFTAAGACVPVR